MALEMDQRGAVAILRWDDGENRMNLGSMAEWHAALDQLEQVEGPLALVVTGGGKFFSNGLDLDRSGVEPDEMAPTVRSVHLLLGRMLLFPAYTVAAVNGHAFAAGATLSAGMVAAVTARLPADAAHDAILTGRRYTAEEALALGIVTDTSDEARLLDLAIDLAAPVAGKARAVIREHRRLLFGEHARRCGYESDPSG